MKLNTRLLDGVTIIELKGKITIGTGDVALREAVDAALEGGSQSLLINFSRVSRMDSSGLGELVSAHRKVTAIGGEIKLVSLPSSVGDVFEVTHIDTVFDVFEDEEKAVASFKGGKYEEREAGLAASSIQ